MYYIVNSDVTSAPFDLARSSNETGRFLFEVRADVPAQHNFAPSGLVVMVPLDCEIFSTRFSSSYTALEWGHREKR
jgi:hypothetical protein